MISLVIRSAVEWISISDQITRTQQKEEEEEEIQTTRTIAKTPAVKRKRYVHFCAFPVHHTKKKSIPWNDSRMGWRRGGKQMKTVSIQQSVLSTLPFLKICLRFVNGHVVLAHAVVYRPDGCTQWTQRNDFSPETGAKVNWIASSSTPNVTVVLQCI